MNKIKPPGKRDCLIRINCIFHSIPATNSGRSRPPLPIDSGHRFRSKPATPFIKISQLTAALVKTSLNRYNVPPNLITGGTYAGGEINHACHHPRIKSPLTTKSVFDSLILIISAHCTFPYVGLQPNPVYNSLFSLIQLLKSEFLSINQYQSEPAIAADNLILYKL
jgi:hypothetical protein